MLRHYATILMQTTPKKLDLRHLREQRSLLHTHSLIANAPVLPPPSFHARKPHTIALLTSGAYLADPSSAGQPAPNPMTDPAGMENMMSMMKGNMAMMIPQTLIMSWINAFFAGFVILKLPFPLTVRFKSMLQSGVGTRDLDVRWVSSLSWYFLNLFGLQAVFTFILGDDNAASQMSQQVGMMNPGMQAGAQGVLAPGVDKEKAFAAEAENLEVVAHWWVGEGAERRVLDLYG